MADNETILRAAIDAITAGDADAIAEVLAEDMVVHVPGRSRVSGTHRGRGAFGARVREVSGGTLKIEAHDVLGSPDHAVGVYVMRVDAPGRSFAWRHVNVYHVRAGKIVEVWSNPFEQDEFDAFFS
ncbi:MAG: nuclear transport factor 2 family protein [Pseudonocardia sp.]